MQDRLKQPALFSGRGEICIGKSTIGIWPSPIVPEWARPHRGTGSHREDRDRRKSYLNNNAALIAERSSINIADNTLLGHNFSAYDSDFHFLEPSLRSSGLHKNQAVSIGSNVFIGADVTVLEDVPSGDNSVIANGSIVNSDITANVIAGGIPVRSCALEAPGTTL